VELLHEENSRLAESEKQHVELDLERFKLGDRNLDECFYVFNILHRLLDNRQTLIRCTLDILRNFHADNVCYLELRTTPRRLYDQPAPKKSREPSEILLSKDLYIESVIQTYEAFEKEIGGAPLKLIPRLLISVDRSKSVDEAKENIELAIKYSKSKYLVGVDFSV